MPKSSKKAGKLTLKGVKKPLRTVAKTTTKKTISGGALTNAKRNNLSALNGLSIHPVPEPIDDNKILQDIKGNKFPVQGPTIKLNKGIDGSGMVVAILDTGVFEHDDLKGKIIDKFNFEGKKELVEDRDGHGTHIAGIIAGSQSKNIKEIKGIAPGAKIVSVKITVNDLEETALWHLADGLERIKEYNKKPKQKNKVTTIVICFNAFDRVDRYTVTQHHRLAKLIKEFYDQDIPVICSSGNNYDKFQNQNGLAYPAYLAYVIACAATYNQSNGGPKGLTKFAQRIDPANKVFNNFFLTAPGYKTISTGIASKSSYTTISGSSQSAAVIAGTILLIQQQSFQANKKMPSVKKIVDLLRKQN